VLEAISQAGYKPGKDIGLRSIRRPASFIRMEVCVQEIGQVGQEFGRHDRYYAKWVNDYPIVSLEDGLSENDWEDGRC